MRRRINADGYGDGVSEYGAENGDREGQREPLADDIAHRLLPIKRKAELALHNLPKPFDVSQ